LEAAIADFERRGWLVRRGQFWAVPNGGMPWEVPAFLQGVAALQASLADKETSYTAVTMPMAPSALATALPAIGVAHAALLSTADAMSRVAIAAEERMTILTPFLNADGLRFVAALFECSPATSRTLVLRQSAAVLRVLADDANRLVNLGVRLLNYHLPCNAGYETFHAKVVLADRRVAYIGSANMLGYTRQSVELGVVVHGRPAEVVSTVVRAIEAVAVPMTVA
jgi:hypothetical protein